MSPFVRKSLYFSALALFLGSPTLGRDGAAPTWPSQRLDPQILKIVSEISVERITEILRKLESFETRNTLSDPNQPDRAIGAARQWIFDQFKTYSRRLAVSYDIYSIPKGEGGVWKDVELRNVVAVLPGKMAQARDRWILVTGHYDSVNGKIPAELGADPARAAEIPAPGVTDNGSGTACVMECARVLSQYEFDATLVFVAFAGEEQGLLGSRAMARRLKESSQTIEAVLNNDIIGSEVGGNGLTDNRRILAFSEDPNDSQSRQVARFARKVAERYVPEMAVDLVFRHDRFGRSGDHTAFNQEGFPGIRFTTPNENFANQHTATDIFLNSSPTYTVKVVRINAAVAAAMALAPRSPVTILGSQPGRVSNSASPSAVEDLQPSRPRARGPGLTRGSGYDAVLRWEHIDPEPDLAGFMVIVRSTTAADWEREIWVGNVREFTMKDTPIDQLVFGVKSVDREGHESPASAYSLPLPRR